MFKHFSKNNSKNEELFCNVLPTKPRSMGKILVSGASGYIGGRLVPELLARGYRVRVMVRREPSVYQRLWPEAEVMVADALNREQLRQVFEGIENAYYLIHSLHLGPKKFESIDIQSALNFREIAQEKRVKRIIYLGGLGDIRVPLSSHLHSRMEVAEELKKGDVQVTILRAAIIIGSGSASYEIIQHLVRRMPILLVPHFAENKCQPIAIRDVIKYLVGVTEVPETIGRSFDIGGQDILTYSQMLHRVSNIMHKKVFFIRSIFSNIPFYAYWASLLTPVPNALTQCLLEGIKNEVICQNDSIKQLIDFEPISFKEAVVRALSREEQDKVYTRWSDAYPPAHELAIKLHECLDNIAYCMEYSIFTKKETSALFESICKIGGKEGWFNSNWLWRVRGLLDRLFLGVGTSRGRKNLPNLAINDVIDFWRIEDLRKDKKLLLRAEMKIPGRAWLEFNIEEQESRRKLSVIAYYDTDTMIGRVYWYLCLPFHHFIFNDLLKGIEQRS